MTQKFDRGSKKKNKQNDDEWRGAEDVEKVCTIFTQYLTSDAKFWAQDQSQRSEKTQSSKEIILVKGDFG